MDGGGERAVERERKPGWEPGAALSKRYREELIETGLGFGEVDMVEVGAAGEGVYRHSFWREISLSRSAGQRAGKMKRIAQELQAMAGVRERER